MTQMNQAEKRPEETAAITLLRLTMPDFPKGRLVSSESPDFIVIVSRKESVGIEITRIDPSSERNLPAEGRQGTKQSLNLNTILSTISRKDEKKALYQKKKLSRLWLVIVSGYDLISPDKRIPPNLDRLKIFSSTFHRIILLDFAKKKHHILFDESNKFWLSD